MAKIEFNKISNLFEENEQGFLEEDENTANFYKEIFPYKTLPKISFNNKSFPINTPKKIWITDTTFRDGQQSMQPFSEEQILKLFDLIHELDNDSGIIKQTEFFLYSERDRKALEKCMSRNYKFPEITSWIRANKDDLKLVKKMGIKETGILMSCSDYHIYKKLNMNKKEAMLHYTSIVEEAINYGIFPRCHFEDITRADFYGFVLPLASKFMEISKKSCIPIKIRACDTLGLGISYSGASIPRSVQGIIYGLNHFAKVPSKDLEWHGHNDFYSVVPNSVTAWLYGASAVNTTLLGIGERTGNCPLEAMLIEYGQLRGNIKNVQLEVITKISDFFRRELKYEVPPKTPYIGSEFNVTRAGIHADGILKDEEIYNIFDTEKILGRPIVVAVNEYSGHAGVAAWINTYFRLKDENKIDKKDPRVLALKEWIDKQYMEGRSTVMRNDELLMAVQEFFPELLTMQVDAAC